MRYRFVVTVGLLLLGLPASLPAASPAPSWMASWGVELGGTTTLPQGLTGVRAAAAGPNHDAAILDNGSVVVWGYGCDACRAVPTLNDAMTVSVGADHLLILRENGEIIAVGENSEGQTNVPPGLSGVVAVAAGFRHSLALKSDGTIVSWGREGTNIPEAATNLIAISAGTLWNYPHFLALRADHTVVAWGDGYFGDNAVPANLSNVVAIAAGSAHSVALKADGTVVCWGGESEGVRTPPPGLNDAVAIAAGDQHSLALRQDGTVVAWSDLSRPVERADEVPEGVAGVTAISAGMYQSLVLTTSAVPVMKYQPQSQSVYASSEDGAQFTCGAIGVEPFTYQWQKDGANISGATNPVLWATPIQLPAQGNYRVLVTSGAGGTATSHVAHLTIDPFLAIFEQPLSQTVYEGGSASFFVHAKGSDPITYQWRRNGIDVPDATNATWNISPVEAALASTNIIVVVSNVVGSEISKRVLLTVLTNTAPAFVLEPHSESVFVGGRVAFKSRASGRPPLTYQWQKNGEDMTGETNATLSIATVALSDAGNYQVTVSNELGSDTSERAALEVRSWTFPTRAAGTVVSFSGPIVPPGIDHAVAVAAGFSQSVALNEDGTVVNWGRHGEFAFGQSGSSTVSNAVAISAGPFFTVALKSDGTAVAWGNVPALADCFGLVNVSAGVDLNRPLGVTVDGRVLDLLSGASIFGISNAVAVSSGFGTRLVLRADGTVFSSGLDQNVFADASNVVQVAAGQGYHLARLADGTVREWVHGPSRAPAGLSNIIDISVCMSHAVALGSDGRVFSWGSTVSVPEGISNAVAIAAGSQHTLIITANPPQPALVAASAGSTNVLVSAPISVSGYVLESSTRLDSGYSDPVIVGDTEEGGLVVPTSGESRFFRFRKQ